MSSTTTHWILTLVCRDQPGIVHAISGAIVQAAGNITESQQFSSADTGTFFMRLQVESSIDAEGFEAAIAPVTTRYGMTWQLDIVGRPLRTLVLVSKAAHCLNDLLYRERAGQLSIDVPIVLSNHRELANLAEFYDVPFESHPVASAGQKLAFEDRVLDVVEEFNIELVVLARYMQILSPELCAALSGKIISATAHFVTSDLDEGPIIEQNVVRVDPSRTPAELVAIGQDEESRTLTQAVKWFAEHRVLLDQNRTIIFK